MRKSIAVFLLVSLVACRDESDVPLASGDTFVRYFGSENNHKAHLAEEAHNGYTLLNTIEIQMDFGNSLNQIQLTHLDYNGNVLWKKKYPSVEELQEIYDAREIFGGFKASSFIKLNSGYLIVGDSINQDENRSKLLLLKIDTEGNLVARRSLEVPDLSLHGKAVAADASEQNFFILGKIRAGASEDEGDDLSSGNDMYLAKISADLQKKEWDQQYGQGQSDPANRLYPASDNGLIWSTTVSDLSAKSDIRMIKALENNSLPVFNNVVDRDDQDGQETISDFLTEGQNFVLVGTSNLDNLDTDLYYARVSVSNGQMVPLAELVFTVRDAANEDMNLNETGVSLCKARDGGYIILGDVESGASGIGGVDYFVMGIDAFGNQQWGYNYGTAGDDHGASISRTSDGGYLVYGTTTFGSLDKTMLIKLNKQGKL
ncbi:MAG TPA: hypothetical protein VD927_03545 [Chryseosolibacter sp.]|nr:hypothetical protein [Chryseosolibacter sp.]